MKEGINLSLISDLQNSKSHCCYFRSSPNENHKKVLIQITERCNLKCVHCFVSSEHDGLDLSVEFFRETLIPYLKSINAERVTLTGGEPLLHSNLFEIIEELKAIVGSITVCTNGTVFNLDLGTRLKNYEILKLNISIDGFSSASHDQFRQKKGAFETTINTIKHCSTLGILGGILVTPNRLSSAEEYLELCKFSKINNAKFILFNPLSNYGRGVINGSQYSLSDDELISLKTKIEELNLGIDTIFANFPLVNECNNEHCISGKIRYVFTNGKVVGCPYIEFAKNNSAKYAQHIKNNEIGILREGSVLVDKYDSQITNGCIAYEMQKGVQIG